MARTLEQIQQEMITAKENEAYLSDLQDTVTTASIFDRIWNFLFGTQRSTSKVAIWRLWMYIVSFSIWTLEKIFTLHTADVDHKLAQLKPHTARWYRNKALAFQYGFDLIIDTDKFNDEGYTEEQIKASKVVKYSAVVRAKNESKGIIKIAGEKNGVLKQITSEQFIAFKAYIDEIKDFCAELTIINYLPDLLRLNIRIVRDVLLLDKNGMEILTGKYPINNAIKEFMKELPFNGELSLQALTDKIQKVNGVVDLSIDKADTRWIDAEANDYGSWSTVDISHIPVSGYFSVNLNDTTNLETLSTITYV